MSCCTNRYKFNYSDDGAGNVMITSIVELLSAAGAIHNPPIVAMNGSPEFDAMLLTAQTCNGNNTDWEILCDEDGSPIAVQIQIAYDGSIIPITAINLDGTPYTGDLTALGQCPATGPDENDPEVTEEIFCDAGVTKSRVTITVLAPDGSVVGTPVVTWVDVTGAVTAAPADPTMVTSGACPVVASTFCVDYC